MYGIFAQTKNGLQWLGNEPTECRAKEAADEWAQNSGSGVDFIMVIPVVHLIDLDGTRNV